MLAWTATWALLDKSLLHHDTNSNESQQSSELEERPVCWNSLATKRPDGAGKSISEIILLTSHIFVFPMLPVSHWMVAWWLVTRLRKRDVHHLYWLTWGFSLGSFILEVGCLWISTWRDSVWICLIKQSPFLKDAGDARISHRLLWRCGYMLTLRSETLLYFNLKLIFHHPHNWSFCYSLPLLRYEEISDFYGRKYVVMCFYFGKSHGILESKCRFDFV